MSLHHEINLNIFRDLITSRNISQVHLASKLNVNEKTFSRWLNKGYPAENVMELRRELGLTREEFRSLLNIPEYKIFFRNKFFADVPDESSAKALDWARVALNSTPLARSSKLLNIDLSKSTDPEAISSAIRGVLGIAIGASFDDYVAALSRDGIEVAVIPFSAFSLNNSREQAFSVFDGKSRAVVFLDSDCNRPALVWNLIHELCHLVRLNSVQGKEEEQLCQEVAKKVQYPDNFFSGSLIEIEKVLKSKDKGIALLEELSDHLNGSPLAIALRLNDFGLLKGWRKVLISAGKNLDRKMPSITGNYFSKLDPSDSDLFRKFWDELDGSNTYHRFFHKVKYAVADGKMTPRKFGELFNIELALATSMSSDWRAEAVEDQAGAENIGY